MQARMQFYMHTNIGHDFHNPDFKTWPHGSLVVHKDAAKLTAENLPVFLCELELPTGSQPL